MIFKTKQSLKRLFRVRGNELPNTYIIGAQKAGTSSMHSYLVQHKDVVGSLNKEVHFFDHDHRYNRGLDWYKRQFPPSEGRSRIMDSTPRYLYIKEVPERISKLNIPSKFIVILRDPLSRSYSAWNMYREFFKSFTFRGKMMANLRSGQFIGELFDSKKLPDYNTLIQKELAIIDKIEKDYEPSIIKRGLYKSQILNWLKYFDKTDILFLQVENMKGEENLRSTLKNVLDFLEVKQDPEYFSRLQMEAKNKRNYIAPLDSMITPESKKALSVYFKEKNEGLDDIIGQEIIWLNN